jgi:hypothetical protein
VTDPVAVISDSLDILKYLVRQIKMMVAFISEMIRLIVQSFRKGKPKTEVEDYAYDRKNVKQRKRLF